MCRRNEFIKNAVLLSLSALLMRLVSVAFNAYIAGELGSAGMGLITLTMSIYTFAVTLATSGVHLGVTRLVAEFLEKGDEDGARRSMKAALGYAFLFGGFASILLFSASGFVAEELLGDIRTRSSLRLLSLSLLPIALSCVFNGYFTARRRVAHHAVTQVAEQGIRISLTVIALGALLPKGLEYACIAVIGGSCIAEVFSALALFVQYKIDQKKNPWQSKKEGESAFKPLCQITLPTAFTAYARSGLITIEHLLIPICLALSGVGREASLSAYASIQSMALPVVLFPAAMLSATAGLLIPEVAGSRAVGHINRIRHIATKSLTATAIFALAVGAVLMVISRQLGELIYNSPEAGRYIAMLAPLVGIMYMDSATDAILKGMGKQVYCMGVNIADAGFSILLVWLLLPKFGADGFIYVIYFTEIVNFALSLGKLIVILKLPKRLYLTWGVALLSAVGAVFVAKQCMGSAWGLHGTILLGLFTMCVYLFPLLLFLFLKKTKRNRILP